MPNVFSEALAPLSKRMPREARDIEVLRVSAHLDGDDYQVAAETARRAALAWAKKRAGRALPAAAWGLQDFDLFAGGRNSTAVRIQNDAMDLWALRAEDPDKDVPGRVWSTEMVIGGMVNERPHFSLRLVVSTAEPEFRIEPHVPGTVLQVVDNPGLIRGGRRLLSQPSLIHNENDAHDLCDHLEDPERRFPVFVVALPPDDEANPLINDELLAKATAGIARTVRIPAQLAWVLSDRFGKYRSVFDGGVRAYQKGFSSTDDPYRHRLFLAKDLQAGTGADACVSLLRNIAARTSISETRLGKDVLDYASVRTASRQLNKNVLTDSEAPDADLLKAAEELVESLEQAVAEKDREIDIIFEEAKEAEDRARTAEQENRSLLYQVRQLKEALAQGGAAPTVEPPLPQDWSDFIEWLDQTYPDKVLLTPAARRMVGSPVFEDVTLVARSIAWLATVQHERRIHGGGSLTDEQVENGIRNSPCGGDTYSATWKGRRYDVDWHIKNGGNVRDPRRCLRIYYFWEPETELTVIDHLPAHRRTGMT